MAMPRPHLPRVLYLSDPWTSHAIAASAYREALSSLGALTDDPEQADVVVFHAEMRRLKRMRSLVPGLAHKHSVALLVWELDRLRAQDEQSVRAMDELWTPTLFSARALVPVHRRVYLMPHVVPAPLPVRPADAATVAGWLDGPTPTLDVLAIMPTDEARKNVDALARAVRALRAQVPQLRLVVKAPAAHDVVVERGPGQLVLRGHVRRGVVAALLARAHVVASAHRAEGWGLTLSDALRRTIPLVCTDFGGQRAFAGPDNAYLVASRPVAVGAHAAKLPFDANALWAEPDPASLEAQLLAAIVAIRSHAHRDKGLAGLAAVRRYDSRRLRLLLAARLAALRFGAVTKTRGQIP
jgi:hypothetical protein